MKSVYGSRVGDFWGNGGQWAANAAASGAATGKTPRVGAVLSTYGHGSSGYGHVAIVSAVNGNTITITEMNARGLGVVSSRTFEVNTGTDTFIYV